MDLIYFLIDFILHIDVHLAELVAEYGVWVYAILFLILFCETGLVVTPFLPGDSLLFVAGALASLETNDLNVHMMVVLMLIAAIVGDAVNYTIDGYLVTNCSVIRIRKSFVAVILIRLISFTRNMAAKRLFSPVLCRSSERSRRSLREWATCRIVISPLLTSSARCYGY